MVRDLKRLGPFGHGNRKPVFCSKGSRIAARRAGSARPGDHLQLYVRQGQTSMKAIAFGAGDLFERLAAGGDGRSGVRADVERVQRVHRASSWK
jgi:single-stranded-DNA-specific exonuclease